MRGRKPKPTILQINEGDPRKYGTGKLNAKLRAEPKANRGLGECPPQLKGHARIAWMLWSEELAVMGLDRRPDAPSLEGACRAYERAVEADAILAREGLIVYDKMMDDEGEVHVLKTKKHPAVDISNRSWLIVRVFCAEFGFSPSARTRLSVAPDENASTEDLVKLLSQPRRGSDLVQ